VRQGTSATTPYMYGYGSYYPYAGAQPYPATSPMYSPMYTYPPQAQTPPTGTGAIEEMGAMGGQTIGGPDIPGMLPTEESYIENILRLNKGKLVTVYATFENNNQWNAKIFKGIIEAAGRDHLILSDPQTGKRILLPMVYLDYVVFDEEIEYEYPYNGAALASYPPR